MAYFKGLKEMKVNEMKKMQRSFFKLNPVAAATLLAISIQFPASNVLANGGGYGANTDISGRDIDVPTYYANSPQGIRPAYDFATHTLSTTETIDTGAPLRKFVDPLPGAYNGLAGLPGQASGIPLAIAEHNWINPANGITTKDDYYEIAIVEYTQQMHRDLPKQTTLRGYVQIETPAIAGLKDVTGIIGSEHIAATYPDGTAIKDASGNQVYWVHKPHYLGPVIVASKGTAVRMKYTNYLPYTDAAGNRIGSPAGGEMPIPVDESIAGGGPILDVNGHPIANKFSQNRAEIHWHGGDTPWISDGTPHQWVAPKGDVSYTNGIGKGVSFQNVPDMPDPGEGSGTLYFPNNLSGRLMFYHDHTSGLTRLNVYMGEAAGYVVVDPVELNLVANALGTTLNKTLNAPGNPLDGAPIGLLDSVGIPLVIQDKTFVPKNIGAAGGPVLDANGLATAQTQSQDAKWDLAHWGQPGDLWFPHVYETNQDPNSIDGTNPVGRWDWGPWFWPVFPAQYSLPTGTYGDVTTTPEAFMDTPTVNGLAYPTLTVDPKTYRFRILSAGNDRTLNLSLFKAVDAAGTLCDANNTAPALAAPMPGALPLAACTEVKMVPATPTANFPATWPTDGRAGGVPDPTTAGPDIVQIGSEGGLLPAPMIHKAQPITYDIDKRSITILNVLNHGLQLGGAERADVLIDFSKYAGQTLIVYSDAPTPMPAVDPRTDFYTGMGDMTDAGGAYDVLPGYGPNTRTVMQIKVNATNTSGTGGALDTVALANALPAAYAATQPAPIIPEVAYNAPFGTNDGNNYASIFTGSLTKPLFNYSTTGVNAVNVINGGSGYTVAPTVELVGGGTGATATATIDAFGTVTGINVTDAGTGYTSAPTVKFIGGGLAVGGVAASATATTAKITKTLPVINKAIQELFDPVFGRMNATLAVELPFSSATIATTIPLAYIDTPIDSLDGIKDGETQIWKITHNGVDSHPVHFHLVNVQLINRVDWAGVIKPPAPNETGWKETIFMNPLEDVYVAVKAVRPVTPFGLPTSSRVLDPGQAIDSTLAFTNIDPITGQAPRFQTQLVNGISVKVPTPNGIYANKLTDFDNEYVWHCHILGHEENDFMRPFIFHPTVIRPDAPSNVALVNGVVGNTLTWTDPTPYGGVDADGVPTAGTIAGLPGAQYTVEPTNNPKNEIGFKVLRVTTTNVTTTTPAADPAAAPTVATVSTNATTMLAPTAFVPVVPANATSWANAALADVPPADTSVTDPVTGVKVDTAVTYAYSVVAYNVAGDSISGVSVAQKAPTTPGVPNVPVPPVATAPAAPTGFTQTYNPATGQTTLTWNAVPGATGYIVSINGVPQPVTTLTTATLLGVTNQTITVAAVVNGVTGYTDSLFNGAAYRPVALTAGASTIARRAITLTWANNPLNVNNVTGLTLTWVQKDGGAVSSKTFAPTDTGATIINLQRDKDYNFTLLANGVVGNSPVATIRALSSK